MREFYSSRLSIRKVFSSLHLGGKLFQEYVIDAWVKIEQNTLNYVKLHQKDLRAESYTGLTDYIQNMAEEENARVGKKYILPSSFTGSHRAMIQQYQDAMAIVSKHGKPDFFITFTCNAKWPEITENLLPNQTAADRSDIVSRVFKLKLANFIEDLKKGYLGEIDAIIYTIEWQKRGLPHCHYLIILKSHHKLQTPEDVNSCISAKIPDEFTQKELFEAVKTFMVHNPCGKYNPNSPCMVDGKCSKCFPKDFTEDTKLSDVGYAIYRRRNNGRTAEVRGKTIDSRWVAPYNPFFLLKYKCHINVEFCYSVKSVKYIVKYIHKGHDRASIKFYQEKDNVDQNVLVYDEVKAYLDARYIAASEAMWRILEFPLQYKSHSIYRLQVHLPGEQTVIFETGNEITAQANANHKFTTLIAWFNLNKASEEKFGSEINIENLKDSRNFIYSLIPEYFTYEKSSGTWNARKYSWKVIGRIYSVNPKNQELYPTRNPTKIQQNFKLE